MVLKLRGKSNSWSEIIIKVANFKPNKMEMSEHEYREIENREIRGVTNRLAIIIIGCTITLTSSFVGVYFGLKGDIQHVVLTGETRDAVSNGKFEVIKSDMQTLKDDIQGIKKQVEELNQKKR